MLPISSIGYNQGNECAKGIIGVKKGQRNEGCERDKVSQYAVVNRFIYTTYSPTVWLRVISLVASSCGKRGFDHGVGHPLLLLYDAKTPHGQKIKEFNGLGDDPFNASISLF